jgi:hypothetical protein
MQLNIYNACFPIYENGRISLESINFNIGNYFITDSFIENLKYDHINLINDDESWRTKKFFEIFKKIITIKNQNIVNFQDHISKNMISSFEKILINLPDDVKIIGIGVNNFHHENMIPCFNKNIRDKLLKISTNSIIGVRGKITKNFLNINGIKNTEIIGCPSYFRRSSLMLPKIDAAEFLTENAIIGGDFNHPKFKSPGAYLVQGDYDKSLVEILRQADQSAEGYMLVNLNQLNDANFSFNHSRPKSIIFPLKFSVFLGDFLRQFKFYIGSRIHGCIIANYYGIPAICTNWDMRAIEMCTYLNIPHIMNFPSIEDTSEFLETFNLAIDYQNASYYELHNNYLNFLDKNGLIYVEK